MEFIEWLKVESPSNVSKYSSKLNKVLLGKTVTNPQELRKILEPYIQKRDRHALNAVRTFLRFLVKTGRMKASEVEDYRAVIPTIKTNAKSETEKAITPEEIVKAYRSIQGEEETRRIRQLLFKILAFSGLRITEAIALLNQFNVEIVERSYNAFNIPKHIREKVAIYDMETVKIQGRKEETKRTYVAIFPKELVSELVWFRSLGKNATRRLLDPERMFTPDSKIKPKLLRTFHMNFLNDNAFSVEGVPADVYRIIEFMQGRTHKDVGGRNYRANVQTAVRLYYGLLDEFKKTLPIL